MLQAIYITTQTNWTTAMSIIFCWFLNSVCSRMSRKLSRTSFVPERLEVIWYVSTSYTSWASGSPPKREALEWSFKECLSQIIQLLPEAGSKLNCTLKKWTWARDQLKTNNWTTDNSHLAQWVVSLSRHIYVTLVSGYPCLTASNWPWRKVLARRVSSRPMDAHFWRKYRENSLNLLQFYGKTPSGRPSTGRPWRQCLIPS